MTLAVATFLSTSTTGLVVMPLASPPGASALSYPGQRRDFLLFACVMLVHWEAVQPTVMWDHAFVAACQAYHHCRPRAVASVSCDSKCL